MNFYFNFLNMLKKYSQELSAILSSNPSILDTPITLHDSNIVNTDPDLYDTPIRLNDCNPWEQILK